MHPRFALIAHPLVSMPEEEDLSSQLLRCRRKIIEQDLTLGDAWARYGGKAGVSKWQFYKIAARFEWRKKAWLYAKLAERPDDERAQDGTQSREALQRELSSRVLALVDRLLKRMEEDVAGDGEKKLDEKTLKNLWAIADSAMTRQAARETNHADGRGNHDEIEFLLIRGADPEKVVRPSAETDRLHGDSSRR